MRIRETRSVPGGMNADRPEERVIEHRGKELPAGAEEVDPKTPLHDWRPAGERPVQEVRQVPAADQTGATPAEPPAEPRAEAPSTTEG